MLKWPTYEKKFTNISNQNNTTYLIICRHTARLFQICIHCPHSSPFNIALVYSFVSSAPFVLLLLAAVWRHLMTHYFKCSVTGCFILLSVKREDLFCCRHFSPRVFISCTLQWELLPYVTCERQQTSSSVCKDSKQISQALVHILVATKTSLCLAFGTKTFNLSMNIQNPLSAGST